MEYQLMRISALLGIFEELHKLFADAFADALADRCPTLANHGLISDLQTPVDAMIRGGTPAMLEIRQHVGALRQGL